MDVKRINGCILVKKHELVPSSSSDKYIIYKFVGCLFLEFSSLYF